MDDYQENQEVFAKLMGETKKEKSVEPKRRFPFEMRPLELNQLMDPRELSSGGTHGS